MRPEMTSNAWALRRCTMPAQQRIANPRLVKDHRGGEEKAFHALVGQAMQACRGKNVRRLGPSMNRVAGALDSRTGVRFISSVERLTFFGPWRAGMGHLQESAQDVYVTGSRFRTAPTTC